MTDDERDHDFEVYADKLSKLRPGDIGILSNINDAKTNRDIKAKDTGFASEIPSVSEVSESFHLDAHHLMGAIDRLETNELVQVVHQNLQVTRVPGVWFDPASGGLGISRYSVAPTILGVDLLQHVVSIDRED